MHDFVKLLYKSACLCSRLTVMLGLCSGCTCVQLRMCAFNFVFTLEIRRSGQVSWIDLGHGLVKVLAQTWTSLGPRLSQVLDQPRSWTASIWDLPKRCPAAFPLLQEAPITALSEDALCAKTDYVHSLWSLFREAACLVPPLCFAVALAPFAHTNCGRFQEKTSTPKTSDSPRSNQNSLIWLCYLHRWHCIFFLVLVVTFLCRTKRKKQCSTWKDLFLSVSSSFSSSPEQYFICPN